MHMTGITFFSSPPHRHPKILILNFLLKLISFNAKYTSIFREVGILTKLINALKEYAAELKEEGKGEEGEGEWVG